MIRLTTFVAFLALASSLSFGQSSAMTPEREAEIYKTTRSAIVATKGRAASKDLSEGASEIMEFYERTD